jgi:hypothetical protein
MAEFVVDNECTYSVPVQLLIAFSMCQTVQDSLRISAAAAAAPYIQARFQAIPPPQYVNTQIKVPDFQSAEQAEHFLLNLAKQVALGELDFQSANEVASRILAWINSKRYGEELELKRLTAGQDTGEQTIHVTGGLPPLPGTNITMPQFNGHAHAELLPPVPQIESTPARCVADSTPDPQQRYYRGRPIGPDKPGPPRSISNISSMSSTPQLRPLKQWSVSTHWDSKDGPSFLSPILRAILLVHGSAVKLLQPQEPEP